MKIIAWSDLHREKTHSEVCATIGVFDGFHLGHQRLLKVLKEQSGGLPILVVTFSNNPKSILRPQEFVGDLLPLAQKVAFFESFGVDFLVMIDFSLKFSRIDGKVFFQELIEKFPVKRFIWGYDFSFGAGSKTTRDEIASLGQVPEIISVDPAHSINGNPISSTEIRNLIREGNLQKARDFLGYPYALYPIKPDKELRDVQEIPLKMFTQVIPSKGDYLAELNGKMHPIRISHDKILWEEKLKSFPEQIKLFPKE